MEEYEYDSDSDGVPGPAPPRRRVATDLQTWTDYHHEFLVVLYHQLIDQARAMGVAIADQCEHADFVEFCHRHSSGHLPPC
jgi:hypothetical protein